MNLTDATLVLLLAARIPGTDEAIRASAKSGLKKFPRGERDLIYEVIDSCTSLDLVSLVKHRRTQNSDTGIAIRIQAI